MLKAAVGVALAFLLCGINRVCMVEGRVASASGKGTALGPIDINRGEQYIKCSQRAFTAKYKTDRLTVRSTTKNDIATNVGGELWTSTFSGSGVLKPNKIDLISFLMPQGSKLTARLETDTRKATLTIIKGELNMNKFINKEDYEWAARAQGETALNITDFAPDDDYDEYFVVATGSVIDYVEYSYAIAVTYSLYNTSAMPVICEGKLTCKFNSENKQDFCAVFEYPKDALLPRAEIVFPSTGLSTKAIISIVVAASVVVLCFVVLCLITRKMSKKQPSESVSNEVRLEQRNTTHETLSSVSQSTQSSSSPSFSPSTTVTSSSSSSSSTKDNRQSHVMMVVTLSSSEEEDESNDGKNERKKRKIRGQTIN